MAKGKKTGGRDIKPGQVIPGAGRPKLTEIERIARDSMRSDISELWLAINGMTVAELQVYAKSPERTVKELAFSRSVIKAATSGNLDETHRFYDRVLGKPKQSLDTNLVVHGEIVVFELPNNGRGKDEIENK